MTHDRNFETTMKKLHTQVTKRKMKTNEKRSEEEMVTLQQNQNINSLNGNNLD